MQSRRLVLGGVGIVLLAVSSCTYLRQLVGWVAEKPQIKIVDLETKSFTSSSIELVFVLDVFNPNPFTLDVDRLDYQVSALGIELGKGAMIEPVVLQQKATTRVRLPFAVDPESGRQLFKKYLFNPHEFKLKLFAQLFLNTAFGKMDMRFEDERALVKGGH